MDHHPDCGDPETNHMVTHEVERLREVNERLKAKAEAEAATTPTVPEDPAPALVTGKAVALDEFDHLKYQVFIERAQKLQLLLEKKATEFRAAQEEQRLNSDSLGALLDGFGLKYKVDFHTHQILADGKVVPIQPR